MEEITEVCDQGEESEKCMDQRDKKVTEAYSHTQDKSGLDTDTSFNDSAYVNDGGGEMLDTSCKQGQNSVRGVTSDLGNTFHKESHKKCNEMSDNIDIKLVPEDGLDCSLSNEKEEFSYRSFMKKDDSGIDIGRSPTSIKEMSVASDIDNSEISESFTESSINSRDNSDSVSDTFTDSGAVKDASDSVSDSISDIGAVLKENSDSVSDSINDIGAVLKENGNTSSDSISVRVAVMEENQNIDRSHVVDKKTKKSDKFCDSVPETVTNNKDDDYMPQSIDTEDSDPCGYYDVTMSSAKDSEDEMESAFKATSKTKRKFRRPRIDSNSDTDSNPGDELHQSSLDSNTDTDSNMDESSLRLKNRESAHDSDDEEKLDLKKDSDEDDDEEDDDNYVDPANKKPTHLWKALYDIREREMGYSNKSPPSVFREKVQGSVQMVQRFKLQTKMEYHEGCVNALHFNRIGTLLASGSDDLNIVLWNWIRSRPALIYDSGHRSNVFQAKFMPFSGDCHVVSCARDGQIRLAELSLTGVCKGTKKLAQHRGAAHKLALEFDSPHVFLSCGEDALVYEIDLRQEKPNKLSLTKESDRKVPLYSIHSNPSNSYEFCVGGRDHFIRIYDKRKIGSEEKETGLVKKYCPDHLVDSDVKANVTCAVYNYNGTEVMGSYNDEDIYLFSNQHSDGAEYIHKYSGHRNNATVKGVNFYGPKSEFVVTGSDCGHIYLWDRESETVVQFLEGDEGGVINVLEPHPFAPVLATSGLDHDVKIWSPTAEEPTKLKGLKKVLNRNKKERDEERSNEPDMLDGQMLWYIMHQLRRVRRRNEQRGGGGDGDDRDNDSSSSDNSDMDSDGMEEMPDRLQCAPS